MTEIRRQKDPDVKTAVEHLAKGTPGPGLRALGSRVVQVGKDASDDKLASAAFTAYRPGDDRPAYDAVRAHRGRPCHLLVG